MNWRAGAACRDVDPELFFPTAANGAALVAAERRALSVCRVCPVLDACRSWAIVEQPHGIAGGMTEDERRRARQAMPCRTGRAEVPAVVPARHCAPTGPRSSPRAERRSPPVSTVGTSPVPWG
ncbi:WhiB family transcriptional regulator [Pseudonocardia sp. ICBG1122]|nr:WhiB family transcriptional regulator [Pseudonocardia pini]